MTARKGFDEISKYRCIKRDYVLGIEYKLYTYESMYVLYVSIYV